MPQDDGVHTYVSVKFPLFDRENQVYAVCGISTDITARNAPRPRCGNSRKCSARSSTTWPTRWSSPTKRNASSFSTRPPSGCSAWRDRLDLRRVVRTLWLVLARYRDALSRQTTFPWHAPFAARRPITSRCSFAMPAIPTDRGSSSAAGRLRDEHGHPRGGVAVCHDVTERKAAEEQLRLQNERLQEAAEGERQAHETLKHAEVQLVQAEKLTALGQMVAGVAHEINNPLAFVSNNLAVLERDVAGLRTVLTLYRSADDSRSQALNPPLATESAPSPKRSTWITRSTTSNASPSRSREGLRRIQQIVKDLRDFARLDDGDLQAVDLNIGVTSTVNIILGRAMKQEVEIDVELNPHPSGHMLSWQDQSSRDEPAFQRDRRLRGRRQGLRPHRGRPGRRRRLDPGRRQRRGHRPNGSRLAFSTRSSRPNPSARAPASASRSATASFRPTAARSPLTAHPARARASPSSCRFRPAFPSPGEPTASAQGRGFCRDGLEFEGE